MSKFNLRFRKKQTQPEIKKGKGQFKKPVKLKIRFPDEIYKVWPLYED